LCKISWMLSEYVRKNAAIERSEHASKTNFDPNP
jgi:hypothetical protein